MDPLILLPRRECPGGRSTGRRRVRIEGRGLPAALPKGDAARWSVRRAVLACAAGMTLPACLLAPDPPAPSVISVSPMNDQRGVAADATIEIVFDTPMDPSSVAAAWSSPDLEPGTGVVTFGWDAAGTTLTVTPTAPLELATGRGLDPSVVAPRAYAFALDTPDARPRLLRSRRMTWGGHR